MTCRAYYNEFDPYAAQWLRNLIAAGHIAPGDVDERSITDVAPDDLAGYRQCHFFAGIAGWSLAARLAGWPDDRELWTGSAPCQPFSVAGTQRGTDDERHLWPHLFRLASARRPSVLMGEQVAAAVGKDWLDGIAADLERIGYACGATVVPACAVDAPHRRDRLWFVADADGLRRQINPDPGRRACGSGAREVTGPCGACDGDVADGDGAGRLAWSGNDPSPRHRDTVAATGLASAWRGASWIIGHDGKARRVGTRIRRVVDGVPAGVAGMRAGGDAAQGEVEMIPLLAQGVTARVGKLRAFGNAIVPQVASEVIAAYMECRP